MRLSVVCLAQAPGPQVRSILEPLRSIADEILIAADKTAGPADVAEYSAVADRVLRHAYAGPGKHNAWLISQCRGEWVLRIDEDELVSQELVAKLPELLEANVLQHWISLRWVYPNHTTYLREWPWYMDRRPALLRRSASPQYSGKMHELARSVMPQRIVEHPIYHLNLLLASFEERRDRVSRYDAIQPDMVLSNGEPFNQRFYLPESAGELDLAAIADADRAEIARVLAAQPSVPWSRPGCRRGDTRRP